MRRPNSRTGLTTARALLGTAGLLAFALPRPAAANLLEPRGSLSPPLALQRRAMTHPPSGPTAAPGSSCRAAIRAAEHAHAIPNDLLAAIAQVESGRRDPVTGVRDPWPWTIDAEGQGAFYATKTEAIAAVRALQARGVRSIDVGCLQINLQQHPGAFATLDQAFDPATNAGYGARFLAELFAQTGRWPRAAALYHSATPGLADDYRRRVLAEWPMQTLAQAEALGPEALGPDRARAATSAGLGAAMAGAGLVSAFVPPNRMPAIRTASSLAAPGGMALPARGLAFYRAAPVALATRVLGAAGARPTMELPRALAERGADR